LIYFLQTGRELFGFFAFSPFYGDLNLKKYIFLQYLPKKHKKKPKKGKKTSKHNKSQKRAKKHQNIKMETLIGTLFTST